MARTLRDNMPKSHTLLISDVNGQALDKFISETSKSVPFGDIHREPPRVQIARTARELAERSVSRSPFSYLC